MAETHTFKAEIKQLLDILVHSLYTERDIFLRELISNASDALHRVQFEQLTNEHVRDADAELHIRITSDEEAGTLTISDTGIGIEPGDLGRIFDPFYTTSPVGKGTGLGLSICYSIVQQHHGYIDVQSEPGIGTCFTVHLPAASDG